MVHIFGTTYAVANNFSTGRCQYSFQSRYTDLTLWLDGKSQRLLPQKVPNALILCHVWWSTQLSPFPPSDPAQEHLLRRSYYPTTTLFNISLPTLPTFQYSLSTLQSIFLRHNLWHIIYCTYLVIFCLICLHIYSTKAWFLPILFISVSPDPIIVPTKLHSTYISLIDECTNNCGMYDVFLAQGSISGRLK